MEGYCKEEGLGMGLGRDRTEEDGGIQFHRVLTT